MLTARTPSAHARLLPWQGASSRHGRTRSLLRAGVVVFVILYLAISPSPAQGEWETLGGWEADSNDNGYGFLGIGYAHRLTARLSLSTRLSGSYLTYSFREDNGKTTVQSPGVSFLAGLNLSTTDLSLTLLAGPELRANRREREGRHDETDTAVAAGLNGSLWTRLSSRWDLLGLVNFDASNTYTWSRAGTRYFLTPPARPWRFSVGPEVTLQGNPDIFSVGGGGALEVNHSPSRLSLSARLGYKHTRFDVDPARDDLYWGVGFYLGF